MAVCNTKRDAENALEALTAILAELGLELKPAKTRIVHLRELNRFLCGWAGYFRYGISAQFFDKITLHALRRLAGFIAQRHKRRKRYGWRFVAHQTHRMGLIDLNGIIVAPRPERRLAR